MNLNIAGAVVHYNTFIKELPVLKLLNKNIQFNVYDGPNLCQWNGGRVNRDIQLTKEMIEKYNSYGISVSLTFTNSIIDLNDKIGNELLQLLKYSQEKYNIKNKIVLQNEDLRVYLKNNYNFELIYSITGHPSSVLLTKDVIQYYIDLENKYDFIVPKFEFVFEPEFYNNINTSKYELLINDTCVYGCPYYYEHFKAIAEQNSNSKDPRKEFGNQHCSKVEECWLPNFNPDVGSIKDRKNYGEKLGMDYNKEMILKAKKLGYNSFKISGRENTSEQIINEVKSFLNEKRIN
jgi:hypothetical protein